MQIRYLNSANDKAASKGSVRPSERLNLENHALKTTLKCVEGIILEWSIFDSFSIT